MEDEEFDKLTPNEKKELFQKAFFLLLTMR